ELFPGAGDCAGSRGVSVCLADAPAGGCMAPSTRELLRLRPAPADRNPEALPRADADPSRSKRSACAGRRGARAYTGWFLRASSKSSTGIISWFFSSRLCSSQNHREKTVSLEKMRGSRRELGAVLARHQRHGEIG